MTLTAPTFALPRLALPRLAFPRRPLARLLAAAALATAGLLAHAPAASAQTALSEAMQLDPEGRAVLRSEIRKYLLEHPEVIMEAVKVLEDRRAEAEATEARDLVADNAAEIFQDGYSHVAGNPDGDVTVVEFIDYNCGYCKKAHADVRELVESDPNLRYVVKEFPILGPSSMTAAKAALASRAQQGGRLYMAFNDALMGHRGALSDEQVWSIAEDVGLDVAALKAEAETPEIKSQIDRTYALAKKLDIQGTPTFVIGDELVRGYAPIDHMRDVVAAARERQG
ncbi:DsbA family protein [Albimonas sp. CAU 1670]|uniref:DsbA family protein n=1 Tax=Albimonas sp. CAU 1670 TaxID=3032599 RepID=UPI0023DCAB58|nr:DsbA family protein [Albimonas sp. CAU 1670]MDF2232533.1 DsbA family protein [Albimonas sp. CAU 1670]